MSAMFNAFTPAQNAGCRERALAAASEKISSAERRALLATCRWIEADGTDDEGEARINVDQADREVKAACELYERVRRGSATGHELLGLLGEAGQRRKRT